MSQIHTSKINDVHNAKSDRKIEINNSKNNNINKRVICHTVLARLSYPVASLTVSGQNRKNADIVFSSTIPAPL